MVRQPDEYPGAWYTSRSSQHRSPPSRSTAGALSLARPWHSLLPVGAAREIVVPGCASHGAAPESAL